MATLSEVKTQINANIRVKTAANSITPDIVSDELDRVAEFADQGATTQTLTDGATITFDSASGLWAKVTLGGNRAISWTSFSNGMAGVIKVIQDGTGGRTLTWGTAVEPSGGITLNSSAGDITYVGYIVIDGVIRLFNETGTGTAEITKTTSTVAGSGTVVITAGSILIGFLVNPLTSQTGFKIGTSAGADDVVSTQEISTGSIWQSYPILFKSAASQTFYVTAADGSGVEIQTITI